MKIKTFTKFTIALFIAFALSYSIFGQTAEPGSFTVNHKVEVEYIPGSGKWYPAIVIEVLNDGYSYKVKVAPYGDGKEMQTNIHFKRVRAAQNVASKSSGDGGEKTESDTLVFGKYGCTTSKYSGGSYEYIPRGSFIITKDGKYTYYGFKKPSKGTFMVDAEGNLSFKDGYLDKGEAAKIDRPNKFFLVFPTILDNRWTCGLVDDK